MSIIEQINKLPVGAELEHQMSVGFLFLKSDDLKALAESHERLLEACKDLAVVAKTPELYERAIADSQHTAASVLLRFMTAIQEAEKI